MNKENLVQYTFLHFATHGVLDEDDPDLSCIYLQLTMIKKMEDCAEERSSTFNGMQTWYFIRLQDRVGQNFER